MSKPMNDNQKIVNIVDEALSGISGRDLVSSSEMTDLLLDIRLHLITEGCEPAESVIHSK